MIHLTPQLEQIDAAVEQLLQVALTAHYNPHAGEVMRECLICERFDGDHDVDCFVRAIELWRHAVTEGER